MDIIGSVRGPDGIEPAAKMVDRTNGSTAIGAVGGATTKAYRKIRTNDDEIWLLYSGKLTYFEDGTYNSKNSQNTEIFVFDWSGNFLRAYELDTPIYNFAVDFGNRILYGVATDSDNQLVCFRY